MFKAANFNYHRELAENHSTTQGGGWFDIDHCTNRILLYSESHDFGRCYKEDVKKAILEGGLPESLEGFEFYFSEKIDVASAWKEVGPETRIK